MGDALESVGSSLGRTRNRDQSSDNTPSRSRSGLRTTRSPTSSRVAEQVAIMGTTGFSGTPTIDVDPIAIGELSLSGSADNLQTIIVNHRLAV